MQAHQWPHARAVGGLRPGEADRRRRARATPRRLVAGRPRAGAVPAAAANRRRLRRSSPAPTPDHGCADELESDVLFATDSAELTPEGRAMLDRLAPCWSHGRFEIEGHTDNTGTDAINQPLSRTPGAGHRGRARQGRDRRLRPDREGLRLEPAGRRQRDARGPGAQPPRGVPQAVAAPSRSVAMFSDRMPG